MYLSEATSIKKPRALRPGSTIGITAPSSQILPENLAGFLKWIKKKGYKVVLGETVASMQDTDYNSASVNQRAEDFNIMVNDHTIDAIWCAAGGFGAQELAPYIDYDAISNDPKPIIGFSDTTFILNAITQNTGVITFLGPTAESQGTEEDELSLEYCLMLVTGEIGRHTIEPLNDNIVRRVADPERIGTGRLCGGNMTMVQMSIGTDFQVDTYGKIILLEDVGESSYTVERTFEHMMLAGMFNDVEGIVFGEFTEMNGGVEDATTEPSPSVNEIIVKKFGNYPVPSLIGYTFSHGKFNSTFPIGAMATIDATARKLELLESPVE